MRHSNSCPKHQGNRELQEKTEPVLVSWMSSPNCCCWEVGLAPSDGAGCCAFPFCWRRGCANPGGDLGWEAGGDIGGETGGDLGGVPSVSGLKVPIRIISPSSSSSSFPVSPTTSGKGFDSLTKMISSSSSSFPVSSSSSSLFPVSSQSSGSDFNSLKKLSSSSSSLFPVSSSLFPVSS